MTSLRRFFKFNKNVISNNEEMQIPAKTNEASGQSIEKMKSTIVHLNARIDRQKEIIRLRDSVIGARGDAIAELNKRIANHLEKIQDYKSLLGDSATTIALARNSATSQSNEIKRLAETNKTSTHAIVKLESTIAHLYRRIEKQKSIIHLRDNAIGVRGDTIAELNKRIAGHLAKNHTYKNLINERAAVIASLRHQIDRQHLAMELKKKKIESRDKSIAHIAEKLREGAARHKVLKKAVGEKVRAIDSLNSRLEDQKNIIKLRDKVIKDKNTAITALLQRVATQDGRDAQVSSFDTLGHNSAEGMDNFFTEVTDTTAYVELGKAVRTLLDKRHISLDEKSILDFGVGPGIALKALLGDAQPNLLAGYDFSEKALDVARGQLPRGEFSAADIYKPVDVQFDIVLCMEVLEHLEYPERALRVLSNAVRPGGTLLITVPEGRLDRSGYHINFWSPESWKLFLSAEIGKLGQLETGTFGKPGQVVHRNNFAFFKKTG